MDLMPSFLLSVKRGEEPEIPVFFSFFPDICSLHIFNSACFSHLSEDEQDTGQRLLSWLFPVQSDSDFKPALLL
ncbi:MAG TPA: hypothetical protein VHB01_10965 [Nitrosospira sp.]|nr:hypothetical protein [Nitrosospira sp.]